MRTQIIPDSFGPGIGTKFDDVGGMEERERLLNQLTAKEDLVSWFIEGSVVTMVMNQGVARIDARDVKSEVCGNSEDGGEVRRRGPVYVHWMPIGKGIRWETWFNANTLSGVKRTLLECINKAVQR